MSVRQRSGCRGREFRQQDSWLHLNGNAFLIRPHQSPTYTTLVYVKCTSPNYGMMTRFVAMWEELSELAEKDELCAGRESKKDKGLKKKRRRTAVSYQVASR